MDIGRHMLSSRLSDDYACAPYEIEGLTLSTARYPF